MSDPLRVPCLRTQRLLCRLPEPGDAAAMLRYRHDNRAHLEPWEPRRASDYYSLRHCLRVIADGRNVARLGTGFPFLIVAADDGELVGSFTLANVMRGPFQACMLGYGIGHARQGQGLMFEALEAGLEWVFGELRLHRVMANYLPRNRRSARLLERLGFEREGYARSYLQIAGVWEDHVLTARVAHAAPAADLEL